jgi:hypothetical protein
MVIKDGVVLAGLDLSMRPVLIAAEDIWREFGRSEGVTVTSGLEGTHSAGSLHYYGLALDFRTSYWNDEQKNSVFRALCLALDLTIFDVVLESNHIHVEYNLIKEASRA